MNERDVKRAFQASLYLFYILLCNSGKCLAQKSENDVHATGSNFLRYGSGSTQDAANNALSKQYFEEIADTRIFFDNFQLGLRYEMDDPSEVGRSYPATLGEGQGPEFRRRWLAYKKDDVDVQAGDVSALF